MAEKLSELPWLLIWTGPKCETLEKVEWLEEILVWFQVPLTTPPGAFVQLKFTSQKRLVKPAIVLVSVGASVKVLESMLVTFSLGIVPKPWKDSPLGRNNA